MDPKKSLEMYGYEENFIDQKFSKKARCVASEHITQEDLREVILRRGYASGTRLPSTAVPSQEGGPSQLRTFAFLGGLCMSGAKAKWPVSRKKADVAIRGPSFLPIPHVNVSLSSRKTVNR